jgi:small-conductance mechanosensitive channel
MTTWESIQDIGQSLNWGPNLGPFKLTPVNIASGVLFIFLGIWFSRHARALMETRIYPRTHWDEGIRYTFSTTMHYIIMIAAGLMALSALGFPVAHLAVMAGALGVGIGFGLQTIVKDLVSGLILLFERPVRVGEILVVDKQWGVVKAVRVRSTTFETFDGSVLFIPNSELLSSKILNWTRFGWGENVVRIALQVGIAYGSDVEKATEAVTRACRANPNVLEDPPPKVQLAAFADDFLTFNIQVFLATPAQSSSTTSELNRAILGALRELGIAHKLGVPF